MKTPVWIHGMALVLAGCGAERHEVSFSAPEAWLPDPAADAVEIQTGHVHVSTRADGRRDVIVSEPARGSVSIFEGCGAACAPRVISEGLIAPVHSVIVDLDQDGDDDVLVADIGSLHSDQSLTGRVVVLDNDGASHFTAKPIAEGLGRVACAEPADLDGDGDTDVIGCAFGDKVGELFWLERRGGEAVHHTIDPLAGASFAYAFDADGDGDLDVAAVISQLTEEVNLYRNDGHGAFAKETIAHAEDTCYGMSGLEIVDLDGDGDQDLVVTNGDMMDETCQDAHAASLGGVAWFENDGEGRFTYHDIVRVPAAYATRSVDLDGDGDLDVVAACYRDPLYTKDLAPERLFWLENDGSQRFTKHAVEGAPDGIITLDAADIDGDGYVDVFTGSLETEDPIDGAHRLAVMKGLAPRE